MFWWMFKEMGIEGIRRFLIKACVCLCALTGHDTKADSSLSENGPGCLVLGIAVIVVSAVAL